ncbi:MAG: HAMP domain-containing protein [Myxococcales bacterium]|nr:HAMP domain-containing protein [Myxococcales bacterium]
MPASDAGRRETPAFLSLGVKLAVGVAAVVSLVSVLAFVELTSRERQRSLAQKSVAARMVSDLLAASLVAPLDFGDEEAIEKELLHLASNRDVVGARVFGPTGQPLASLQKAEGLTAPTGEGIVTYDDRLEVGQLVRTPAGKHLGALSIVLSLGPENAAFAATRQRIAWLTLLVAAATSTLLLLVTRRLLLRPLSRMARAAARIGQGERGVTVSQPTADELGVLAQAMNAMSASIVTREEQLARTTRSREELLDHMRQAIVVVDAEGRVEEVSSAAGRAIFGDVTGQRLVDVLYPGLPADAVEVAAFEEWRRLAANVDLEAFEELRTLAPNRVAVGDRHLALEFRPLDRDGLVHKMMLLAIDETDRRRLEDDLRKKEAAHVRQLRAMRRLLAGSAAAFVRFVETAGGRLEECRQAFAEGPLTAARVDEIYRIAHTVKGEAMAFELEGVAAEVHAIEDVLEQVRVAPSPLELTAAQAAAFAGALDRAENALRDARELMIAASPIGAAILDQVTVRRSELDALVGLTTDGSAIASVVRRLTARPFGESAGLLAERAESWAASVGKQVRLTIEGGERPIAGDLAARLPGLLAQLVRNAIVHGIEAPDARRAAGKAPEGTIVVSCDEAGVVAVVDDGAGVLDAEPSARPADLLAGRGIGLRAVRSMAMEVGRSLEVDAEPTRGSRFRLVPISPSIAPPAPGARS